MAAEKKQAEETQVEEANAAPAAHGMTRAEAKHWRDQQRAQLAIEAVKCEVISAKEARTVILEAIGLPADPA